VKSSTVLYELHFGAFIRRPVLPSLTEEKKNMSSKYSGEVKWLAIGIPGIC